MAANRADRGSFEVGSILSVLAIAMDLNLSVTEAFMALGLAMVSADDRFTDAETQMLLDLFAQLEIRRSQPGDDRDWEAVFDDTLDKLTAAFPAPYFTLTDAQFDELVAAIKTVVSPSDYHTLVFLAEKVAVADGLHEREAHFLDRLHSTLKG